MWRKLKKSCDGYEYGKRESRSSLTIISRERSICRWVLPLFAVFWFVCSIFYVNKIIELELNKFVVFVHKNKINMLCVQFRYDAFRFYFELQKDWDTDGYFKILLHDNEGSNNNII